MSEKITKNTGIMEALEINPEAADILMEAGLGCIGCSMAHLETLEQGLAAHGLEKKQISDIIEKLNQ